MCECAHDHMACTHNSEGLRKQQTCECIQKCFHIYTLLILVFIKSHINVPIKIKSTYSVVENFVNCLCLGLICQNQNN